MNMVMTANNGPLYCAPSRSPGREEDVSADASSHADVAVNEAWLNKHQEEVVEPDLPIVDVHHHLWMHSGGYMFEQLLADVNSGHNVRASVFCQCRSMYRADGPAEMRPIGETEFVNGVAAMSASGQFGPARLCSGIIGYADLQLGDRAGAVLEAHVQAGNGRFKGIRGTASWDEDAALWPGPGRSVPGLLMDPAFRKGYVHMGRLGLLFEPSVFHPQISDVTDLARAFPDTGIVLNHIGGPITRGRYAKLTEEVFAQWKASMAELAGCPNVYVKLGGLARRTPGVTFNKLDMPPSSEDLARRWKAYIETTIELFGPERCMFESNFPIDKSCYSYRVVWNAFKRICADYSPAEKAALFSESAYRIYGLERA
jgi:L-fuconolactonase